MLSKWTLDRKKKKSEWISIKFYFVLAYDPLHIFLNKDYFNSAIQPCIVLKFDSQVFYTLLKVSDKCWKW